jgi:hypothetical protein
MARWKYRPKSDYSWIVPCDVKTWARRRLLKFAQDALSCGHEPKQLWIEWMLGMPFDLDELFAWPCFVLRLCKWLDR